MVLSLMPDILKAHIEELTEQALRNLYLDFVLAC